MIENFLGGLFFTLLCVVAIILQILWVTEVRRRSIDNIGVAALGTSGIFALFIFLSMFTDRRILLGNLDKGLISLGIGFLVYLALIAGWYIRTPISKIKNELFSKSSKKQ